MNHPWTRRDFLRLAAGTAACGGPAFGAKAAAESPDERPPNILLILVDDLGYGDLGCYGNRFCETPNLDRLAQGGMRFTNGYAAAPICSASRAALLTGRSTARLGFEFVTKWPDQDYATGWGKRYAGKELVPPLYTLNLPLEEETVAECLAAAGYATGITGKWHVSAHYKHYLGWSPTHGPLKQGFAWGQEDFGAHPYGYTKAEKECFGPYASGAYPPDALTESAIAFMREHREQPFFLMASHYYVHVPLGTRCKWLLDKYEARAEGRYDKRRALYGAFVQTLDHYAGQLLDALEALGLAKNTLVVFTSDNGGHPEFAFNAPLRGSKWNLYEGGIRVPLMVRWPGVVAAGSTCDVPVANTDFLPTFREAAGLEAESDARRDGTSLVPLLRGEDASRFDERPLYWHFPYYHPEKGYNACPAAIGVEDGYVSQTKPQSALRRGRYKLLYFHENGHTELYDLQTNIAESHDLSEEMPEKAREMKEALLGYLRSVKARMPQPHALAKEKSSP